MIQNFKLYALLLTSAAAIFICRNTGGSDAIEVSTALLPPPRGIEHFSLGYNENLSDSLWLRVIQDIDHCDAGEVKRGEQCKGTPLGWVFRMLEAITNLTPTFRMPYNHGATILSVVVNDKEGARQIFDRGIEQFPNDWSLQFRAAYHYLYEIGDDRKAAELLTMAGKNGAPQWVYGLAARLYTKEGQAELAKTVLQSVLEEDPDSKYAEKLRGRLAQLEEIIRTDAAKPESEKSPKAVQKSKGSDKKAD